MEDYLNFLKINKDIFSLANGREPPRDDSSSNLTEGWHSSSKIDICMLYMFSLMLQSLLKNLSDINAQNLL
jgi:hypothetical protein